MNWKVNLSHEQIAALPFAAYDYEGEPDGKRKPEGGVLIQETRILVRYLPKGYGQEWRILAEVE